MNLPRAGESHQRAGELLRPVAKPTGFHGKQLPPDEVVPQAPPGPILSPVGQQFHDARRSFIRGQQSGHGLHVRINVPEKLFVSGAQIIQPALPGRRH